MTIIHIVLFEWKSSVAPEKIEEVREPVYVPNPTVLC